MLLKINRCRLRQSTYVRFFFRGVLTSMTIDTDFHSHVVRSSALQMAQAAWEKGLRILGLSEHIFQMTEARPTLQHLPEEGPTLSFNEYSRAVRAAAQEAGIETRLGLEVDYIPGLNEQIQA